LTKITPKKTRQNFRPKYLKMYIFDNKYFYAHKFFDFGQNFIVLLKHRFLTKISIFDQNFNYLFILFCPYLLKFWFLAKTSIFDKIFDFWLKLRFLTKTSICAKNFPPWIKNFDQKILNQKFFLPKYWYKIGFDK